MSHLFEGLLTIVQAADSLGITNNSVVGLMTGICTYIYIHTYIHIYIYIYIYKYNTIQYIHVYIHTCTYIHTHNFVYLSGTVEILDGLPGDKVSQALRTLCNISAQKLTEVCYMWTMNHSYSYCSSIIII